MARLWALCTFVKLWGKTTFLEPLSTNPIPNTVRAPTLCATSVASCDVRSINRESEKYIENAQFAVLAGKHYFRCLTEIILHLLAFNLNKICAGKWENWTAFMCIVFKTTRQQPSKPLLLTTLIICWLIHKMMCHPRQRFLLKDLSVTSANVR